MMTSNGKFEKLKKEREGLCFISKNGESFVIIKYLRNNDVLIRFQNGYEKRVEWCEIKRGTVHSPYIKSVYGVGYIGEGKYKIKNNNKEITLAYSVWKDMIRRCYEPYHLNKYPTYIDCYVCKEWHNFQNFAKWFYKHYYEIPGQRMHLDKDILYKGNKIYSPDTCIFVPERINYLFTKSDAKRGKYPIGVCYHKGKETLEAHCSIVINGKGKLKHLGTFPLNKPFQAFTTYKIFKENYIKQVADGYKDKIPTKLYEALYKWEVEIND